jgi:hypothetical protein
MISMDRKIKHRGKRIFLTTEQRAFILKNHRTMTIREMVDRLKIPTNRIYKFTVRERLDVKKFHKVRAKSFYFKEGMFNPHERENWIV